MYTFFEEKKKAYRINNTSEKDHKKARNHPAQPENNETRDKRGVELIVDTVVVLEDCHEQRSVDKRDGNFT